MILVENKKVRLNYEIMEEFEAGIELFGFEVKALKNKQGSLDGAYVGVRGNEAFLIGAHIPPYQAKNTPKNYDPKRTRKLLLNKKEINKLSGFESQKGLTNVPISWYTKNNLIKLSVGVARGKKKHDKRADLKKRESMREVERTLKYQ